MGCPTGMGDAYGTAHILVAAILTKIIYLTLCLINIQLAVGINQCHTGRVITTILQPSKTLDQDRKSILFTYISNNSAHSLFVYCVLEKSSGVVCLENLHTLLQLVVLMILDE